MPSFESSPSAQAGEDLSSASNWRFPRLASSVGLSGMPSPSLVWFRRWRKADFLKRLCGAMCEPSTADHGAAQWIASLRAIPASRSAEPGDAAAQTIRATCGPRFIESSKRFVPASSFWKTSQAILHLDSTTFAEISNGQASELRRLSSLRRTWARATNANASSFSAWRTPDAPGDGGPRNRQTSVGQGHQLTIAEQAEHWPTPTPWEQGDDPQTSLERREREKAKGRNGNGFGLPLDMVATNWPTPTAGDGASSGSRNLPGSKANAGISLTDLVEMGGSHSSRPAPAMPMDGGASSVTTLVSRRRLNPRFVSWLMGWPLIARAGSDCSGTEWFHFRRHMRFALSSLVG